MKRLCLVIFSALTFSGSFANVLNKYNTIIQVNSEEVIGTVTKNTTEKEFESLIAYFKENGMKLDISEVNYNNDDEIVGIKIILQKGKQKSRYALSSNVSISDLELGSKNGALYITTKGNLQSDQISSIMNEFEKANESLDSFLSEHPFSFSFNSDQLRDLLNGAELDFDALSDQLGKLKFDSDYDDEDSNEASHKNSKSTLPKYSFINSPNINKLIIINGKESSFDDLNSLAKANKLYEVDNLKPATAISIYGEKAKDGAIIATTKK